jgi:hypothetical protein
MRIGVVQIVCAVLVTAALIGPLAEALWPFLEAGLVLGIALFGLRMIVTAPFGRRG